MNVREMNVVYAFLKGENFPVGFCTALKAFALTGMM